MGPLPYVVTVNLEAETPKEVANLLGDLNQKVRWAVYSHRTNNEPLPEEIHVARGNGWAQAVIETKEAPDA